MERARWRVFLMVFISVVLSWAFPSQSYVRQYIASPLNYSSFFRIVHPNGTAVDPPDAFDRYCPFLQTKPRPPVTSSLDKMCCGYYGKQACCPPLPTLWSWPTGQLRYYEGSHIIRNVSGFRNLTAEQYLNSVNIGMFFSGSFNITLRVGYEPTTNLAFDMDVLRPCGGGHVENSERCSSCYVLGYNASRQYMRAADVRTTTNHTGYCTPCDTETIDCCVRDTNFSWSGASQFTADCVNSIRRVQCACLCPQNASFVDYSTSPSQCYVHDAEAALLFDICNESAAPPPTVDALLEAIGGTTMSFRRGVRPGGTAMSGIAGSRSEDCSLIVDNIRLAAASSSAVLSAGSSQGASEGSAPSVQVVVLAVVLSVLALALVVVVAVIFYTRHDFHLTSGGAPPRGSAADSSVALAHMAPSLATLTAPIYSLEQQPAASVAFVPPSRSPDQCAPADSCAVETVNALPARPSPPPSDGGSSSTASPNVLSPLVAASPVAASPLAASPLSPLVTAPLLGPSPLLAATAAAAGVAPPPIGALAAAAGPVLRPSVIHKVETIYDLKGRPVATRHLVIDEQGHATEIAAAAPIGPIAPLRPPLAAVAAAAHAGRRRKAASMIQTQFTDSVENAETVREAKALKGAKPQTPQAAAAPAAADEKRRGSLLVLQTTFPESAAAKPDSASGKPPNPLQASL